jgi:hypothetical protein|tara:strand:- start:249 stop:491 length:243 start_codon:yes stop_codon:yes gene_type:complete
MELTKVTKGGSLHFRMSDGRTGSTYKSGYVRITTKHIGYYYREFIKYQINLKNKDGSRILIPTQKGRLEYLMNYNNKNCK